MLRVWAWVIQMTAAAPDDDDVCVPWAGGLQTTLETEMVFVVMGGSVITVLVV